MKIGICIVDYGKKEYIDKCIESFGQLPDEFELETFDCNKENIGFTRGNNELITKFLTKDVDWVWLLNNDTTVPSYTIANILEILPTVDPQIGVIGFKILSMSQPDLIHHAGTVECFPAGIHKSGSDKLKQFRKVTNEKWVTFASVLIRANTFKCVGLLDSQMFNFFSDSDFCYRARYNGWKVIYHPRFVVFHVIGQSQNPTSAQLGILNNDSLVFQNKYINGKMFFDLDKELV